MPASQRWFGIALGIWLFGVFAFFVPAATWNPVSRFDLTRAVVEQHTLSIDAFHENTGDRSFANGRWYTDKAPVPSLIATVPYVLFDALSRSRGERPAYSVLAKGDVPAVRVTVNGVFQRGLYVCSLFTAGLGAAAVAVLLFHVLSRRFSPRAALFGGAGVVLGTPLLPYGTSFYGHAVAAGFVVAALAALVGDPDEPPGPLRLALGGACVTLAVGSEYLSFVPGSVIVASVLLSAPWRSWPRTLLWLAAGALVPAVVVGGYHAACFGAPWRTGYSFIVRPEFAAGHASGLLGLHLPTAAGLWGLSFGRLRGLFYMAPVTLVAFVAGAAHALRSGDRAARTALAAFVALVLANAGYYMWWGGAAAGPRHLVPVIGLLAFGLAAAWDSRAWWLAGLLLVVSVANFVVLTGVGLEAPDRGDVLADYVYSRFARGDVAGLSGASNLGIRMGLVRGGSLGPLVVWLLLGARFLARRVDGWAGGTERVASGRA